MKDAANGKSNIELNIIVFSFGLVIENILRRIYNIVDEFCQSSTKSKFKSY